MVSPLLFSVTVSASYWLFIRRRKLFALFLVCFLFNRGNSFSVAYFPAGGESFLPFFLFVFLGIGGDSFLVAFSRPGSGSKPRKVYFWKICVFLVLCGL
ncbi:MAG: hypothetical protein QMC37_11810, partial [Flavobacteriales bacterium]